MLALILYQMGKYHFSFSSEHTDEDIFIVSQRAGQKLNINMYRNIIFFSKGDMIFKHISDISIYITSVSHTLIYLWRLTSLNKHEHCTFQNQNAARVV